MSTRRTATGLPVLRAALLAALLAPALPAATPARAAATPALPADARPDSAQLLRWVRYLADPAREGRGVGTAGLDSATAWVARAFAGFGLAPGGDDGTYLQSFEVTTGVQVDTPCVVVAGRAREPVGEEFQPLGFSTNGTLTAPVAFAGYGITAPGYDYDDYAGLDVHGRIVLVLSQEPGEMDSTSRFEGDVNTPHAELRTKAINAREHGALGLLMVNGPRYHAGEPLRTPRTGGAGYMSSGLLAGWVSEAVADSLLAPAGLTLARAQERIEADERPHSLPLPSEATLTVNLRRTRSRISNVVGILRGRDSTRTLVVGAHVDHLGYGGENSLDPDEHVPHVGADDNASGVAALMGVARWEAARARAGGAPEHTLWFCAFTGEESGLLGSGHFVDDPPAPLAGVETMLNMDMVGRLRRDRLMVMGSGTATEFDSLLTHVNRVPAFDLRRSEDGYGPSDHSSFYKRHVPVLMLFTGAHSDYHKASDTWDKIDGPGLARVASFACDLVDSLDRRPRVTFRQARADSSVGRISGGGGYGAYLGTIPDYMQTEGGVLLSGVRAGSPADSAGLRGGDVVVRFDGLRVDNIYDYTFALRSRKPGQQVRITVKRDGREVTLAATLGRRK